MAAILEWIVKDNENKKTVEQILKRQFSISSKLLTYLKLNGKLRINGNVCRSVDTVVCGDIVTADVSENIITNKYEPYKIKLDILYEDDYIAVINKPGNMAVHPSIGNYNETLANAIMYYWNTKGEYYNYHIVNRLDKNTSGLCVIAKNKFAHGILSEQIKRKIFKREYIAIVHGLVHPFEGSIELPIKRESESIIKRIVSPDGKYAKTNYKTIEIIGDKKYSLLKIKLETGRTHQIRVHFSHIGHPLVGDWLYGYGDGDKEIIERHALHAGKISFIHPVNKNEMIFYSDMPEEMSKMILLSSK